MSEPTTYSISEFLQGLVTGIISSGLIGFLFYFLQRKNDEEEQRDFTLFLYTLWKQGVGAAEISNRVENKLDALLKQTNSHEKIEQIESKFNDLDSHLRKIFRKRSKADYIESVALYKELADARADTAISQLDFEVLSPSGLLSIESIRKAHISLFPGNYPWAGKLRNKEVQIIGDFIAGGRNIAPSLSSYVVSVLDPVEIHGKLSELILRWNDIVKHIKQDNLNSISNELAHFHHDFLFIHPFLDGNGRIARVILNEQASYLVSARVRFDFEQSSYFRALHFGDQQEIKPLRTLIYDKLHKSIEQPLPADARTSRG